MIPRLDQLEDIQQLYRRFLLELPRAGFRGDVHQDVATRLVTATDNSVYQILPQAVVYPLDAADVAAFCSLAADPRFRRVTYSARGGGTGTNGQSLADGVIVDVSRHMNGILETDLEAGWVRVQPGVVLDQLNAHLRPHGVFFAPNLSPSSRATIGGMISTDACGKGSRIYGRTSEHVLSMDCVLADGTPWTSRPLDTASLDAICEQSDRVGDVHRTVEAVVTGQAELIADRFPKIRRFMTGYNLARVVQPDGRFDLGPLICGSEGTLALVTEATLRLTPIPTHRTLVVLKYPTFDDALASAEIVVASEPGAIETIDEKVLELARGDVIWHAVGPLLSGDGPPFRSINLVEYEGPDPDAVAERVAQLLETVGGEGKGAPNGAYVARDEAEATALWALRKKGVGLLGRAPGARKPIAFVEDTVVPPAHLAEYVAEFRAILDEAGLEYGMFGHVDVGCLHVRPALDMKDPDDERRLAEITDKVAALCERYGGMLWGEHGKGFRSQYNPQFFGPELFESLCRIKGAFDPHNQLNPGKLAVPSGSGASLVQVDATKRGAFDRQILPATRERYAVALDCNGNGACFDYDPDHVMCPSSKVTRDRIHSPKGRAGVMREWLRQLAAAGHDPLAPGSNAPGSLPARAVRTARARLGEYDYSHEVYGAMAGCLACKACATQCPIKVDVPAFRSEFLALYHTRYLRPLRDHFMAGLEWLLPWMGRVPRLTNLLSQNGLARWALDRLVGIVDPPPLADQRLSVGLAGRGVDISDAEVLRARLSRAEPDVLSRTVVIVQDAFTTFYEPQVCLAVVDLLRALGREVEVLAYRPSGKGQHVKGFLDGFARTARRNAAELRAIAGAGVSLVGIEPAVVLMFRDEVRAALGAAGDGFRVELLQEWLDRNRGLVSDVGAAEPADAPFVLYAHCTERTAEAATLDRWRRIFEAAGAPLETPAVGCCGMSGAYGHERAHLEESRGIFAMSWGRALPGTPDARARVLSTGHSCRSQVKRFAGFVPRHPAQALLERIRPISGG
jgi:FAD/FMN-containing dehydrogenase/Fe-S oxidoreductase